jgi:hypothetical protein
MHIIQNGAEDALMHDMQGVPSLLLYLSRLIVSLCGILENVCVAG